jgi:hypothetical protein
MQAQSLNSLIEQGVAKGAFSDLRGLIHELLSSQHADRVCSYSICRATEGYIGMAIAGGLVAVVGVVAAGLMRKTKK